MTAFSTFLGLERGRFLNWACVLLITFAYLAKLTSGHVFDQDDAAAYIMHAMNLVEGRAYTDTRYVSNPRALWLAPPNGYPPVYPLLLAPVYKMWGMNLRAFKVATVLCFAVFLVIYGEWMRPENSVWTTPSALLILGFNAVFWEQRDYVMSEFPYLMFSFGALLVIERVYAGLKREELRMGGAILLSLLLYCSYGTRTIGIALLPALVIADVIKFRRPSRFMLTVLGITAALIIAQAVLLTSPRGYVSAFELSWRTPIRNALYYSKTLSYVWENGFSKKVQIVLALVFTSLAAAGFIRRLRSERSANEIYLLAYLAILFLWIAEIGLRGLLPILPLYLAYGLGEFARSTGAFPMRIRTTAWAFLLAIICLTYVGRYPKSSRLPPEPDVSDATAQELFAFLRAHTEPSEVLIFPKPRTLALFTNRRVASFDPGELSEDSLEFVKSIHANVIVDPVWSSTAWEKFITSKRVQTTEVFRNSEYRVFRITLDDANHVSSGQ